MRSSTPLTGRVEPYLVDLGYDVLKSYTAAQLMAMYIAEGKPEDVAREMATTLAREMHRMDIAEWRSWSDRWDFEISAGLNPEVSLSWRGTFRARVSRKEKKDAF